MPMPGWHRPVSGKRRSWQARLFSVEEASLSGFLALTRIGASADDPVTQPFYTGILLDNVSQVTFGKREARDVQWRWRSAVDAPGVLDQVEGRSAIGQHPTEFAIQIGVLRRQAGNAGDGGVFLWVQSLPRREMIFTLPASSRACMRYPSSLISCSQSGPSGAFFTSAASCGLTQVGSDIRSTPRVGVTVGREDDLAIANVYQNEPPPVGTEAPGRCDIKAPSTVWRGTS